MIGMPILPAATNALALADSLNDDQGQDLVLLHLEK